MAQPFFAIDAVLDSRAQQLSVSAGRIPAVERATWPVAAKRTELDLSMEPADVLVIGMPRDFHYGRGMGSNPILMLQAIGASLVRAAGALRSRPVVICASVCDGWFNEDEFPATPEVFRLLARGSRLEDVVAYEDDVCSKRSYLDSYISGTAYHPFHGFSMVYMGALAHHLAEAVYIVGAREPSLARGMGCIPVDTFDAALKKARMANGLTPRLLVVPELSRPAFHPRVASGPEAHIVQGI